MAMKVTLSTLPEPKIPIPGTFSHVVTIGDHLAINVTPPPPKPSPSGSAFSARTPGGTRRLETHSSKSYFVENNSRIHIIVLCVGSACSPFAKSNRGRSSGESVAKDLRDFCEGSSVKLVKPYVFLIGPTHGPMRIWLEENNWTNLWSNCLKLGHWPSIGLGKGGW